MNAQLGERGRVLVRASGTEPVVRVLVEATTSRRPKRPVVASPNSFTESSAEAPRLSEVRERNRRAFQRFRGLRTDTYEARHTPSRAPGTLTPKGRKRGALECAESSDTSAARPAKDLLITGLERLEFRGYDSAGHRAARGGVPRLRPRRRQPREPQGGRRPQRLPRDDRPRPHPLGDPRQGQRGQRAPADRLRRRQARDRPQRHRRELPRAQGRARGGRATASAPRPTPRSSRT